MELNGQIEKHKAITALGSLLLAGLIALLDLKLPYGVPLSFLYLIPMVLVGTIASRVQILMAAVLCTGIAEFSDAYAWNAAQGIPRDLLTCLAFSAAGLYVREVLAKRKVEHEHFVALTHEIQAKREAEEQLSLLVGSSALAILTLDEAGVIVQANQAAGQMFANQQTKAPLLGSSVNNFLPTLMSVVHRARPDRPMRTVMQAQAFRRDGDPFLAEIWFSSYSSSLGSRTAAIIVDVSEALCDREESTLEQLLNSSKLAVGAMAHEIRNVCGAIQLVERNLIREIDLLKDSPDFIALQQLTSTLERMASTEVTQIKYGKMHLPLQHTFEELRIVAQAMMREHGISLQWNIEGDLPTVWADKQGLTQVILNILRNAHDALKDVYDPMVSVDLEDRDRFVAVRVSDNGPGVPHPESLFRPFDGSASSASFGLYLSRAIVNSFHGEISYEDVHPGARFIITLQKAM